VPWQEEEFHGEWIPGQTAGGDFHNPNGGMRKREVKKKTII
jgi:hypothetical protein